MTSAAIKTDMKKETKAKTVHLSGFARWRDKGGRGFAPCGALISSAAVLEKLHASSSELSHVTCPVCQEQAGALGKAYMQARRQKEISW